MTLTCRKSTKGNGLIEEINKKSTTTWSKVPNTDKSRYIFKSYKQVERVLSRTREYERETRYSVYTRKILKIKKDDSISLKFKDS